MQERRNKVDVRPRGAPRRSHPLSDPVHHTRPNPDRLVVDQPQEVAHESFVEPHAPPYRYPGPDDSLKRTLRNDRLTWTFAIVACAITVIVQKELAWMFIATGVIGALAFGRSAAPSIAPVAARPGTGANAIVVITGAAAFSGTTAKLFQFFFKTGLLVFGSGLVIVPFLKTQVVDQYHWLGDRQFLDSVAIGMISPGPVVITATFVGYLLNGMIGALAATIGIFPQPVLFTVLATPILLRYYKHPRVAGFIRGVGAMVVGVLVGTTWLVGREAIGDWLTAAIALGSLFAIIFWEKLPEPLGILAGGTIGLLTYQVARPEWLLR